MDNRKILDYSFRSVYFSPGTLKTKKSGDSYVDFYIFFTKKVSLENICAFHVSYSYIHKYVNSPSNSEAESFIMEIILHHKVVDTMNNPNSGIKELYLSLLEYFCYGQEMQFTIDSYPDGGFGIVALFDEDYHHPSITSIVEPEVNQGKFYF